MQLHDREFLGAFIWFHDAEIGNHRDGAFAGKTEALTCFAAIEVTDGSNEVEFLYKGASGLFENEYDFVRATRNFGSPSRAG
jgi:hypothetical protein